MFTGFSAIQILCQINILASCSVFTTFKVVTIRLTAFPPQCPDELAKDWICSSFRMWGI